MNKLSMNETYELIEENYSDYSSNMIEDQSLSNMTSEKSIANEMNSEIDYPLVSKSGLAINNILEFKTEISNTFL